MHLHLCDDPPPRMDSRSSAINPLERAPILKPHVAMLPGSEGVTLRVLGATPRFNNGSGTAARQSAARTAKKNKSETGKIPLHERGCKRARGIQGSPLQPGLLLPNSSMPHLRPPSHSSYLASARHHCQRQAHKFDLHRWRGSTQGWVGVWKRRPRIR